MLYINLAGDPLVNYVILVYDSWVLYTNNIPKN